MNRRRVMIMKKNKWTKRLVIGMAFLMVMVVPGLEAQFLEDALRLDYGMLGSGARSLSMGTAYLAVADDFSATFYNPAGLAQIRDFEIAGGLRHTTFRNNASHLGNITEGRGSSTNLDNLGIVIPVPTVQGSLTFAIGYNRVNDFTQISMFEGFNENDSIIPDLFYSRDRMSYMLDLADSTGVPFYTRNLQQEGTLEEFGSINNWSFSGGIEAVPNFFVGTTLNLISGNYRHTFLFEEIDVLGIYDTFPDDLHRLLVEDQIDARISGFNAIFGGLYSIDDFIKVGGTIQTPTRYSIEEDYSSFGRSEFSAPGDYLEDEIEAFIDYDVRTPWKFSAGASLSMTGLTVAASVEYQDWTQLEFRNAPSEILSINRDIRETLEPTTNIQAGAEIDFPLIPLSVRGGYIYQPSPYKNTPSELDREYITGGVGFTLQDAISLDLAFMYGMWESDLFIYEYPANGFWNPRFVEEDITKRSVVFSFRYKF